MTPTPPKDFTILLVDDRPENLLLLEDLLEQPNRQFIKAHSGNEALRQMLKNEQIGLVMLDVQMPDMDGFEVAKLLKSNPKTRNTSIIFVTAISKEERYVLKGFEQGAVDYLQKPLDASLTKAKVAVFEQLYFYQRDLQDTAKELAFINAQLEKFVYTVAHDLKSPLTGLIAALSLLEMQFEEGENSSEQEYVDHAKTAAYHLSDMITALLDYYRKSLKQQQVEDVNTGELTRQIAQLLFPPKHISISVLEPMPTLYTRKLKLQQVFQNLLSNAVKYSDKPQGRIEVGAKDIGEFYEFFVRDNGPGITPEQQKNIFSLFQTTTNRSGTADSSTGVGLNILKVLVEEQGGKIRVESQPGQGSTFFFDWKK